MLVLKDLVGLQRTVQLQLLQYYWSGHRLGYVPERSYPMPKVRSETERSYHMPEVRGGS